MTARWQGLKERTASGVLLAIAVLFITFWDPLSFDALLLMGAYFLLCEWLQLTRNRHAYFIPSGFIYIALGCYALAAIRHAYGWQTVYLVFALVWVGDIAAYFIGKRFGVHKLVPTISPGKSWEGLAASVIATTALSVYVLSIANHYLSVVQSIAVGILFSITGLLGDLFESSLKRAAGVKDSGTLIPGHGGLFDRVDALLPCSILAALLLFY